MKQATTQITRQNRMQLHAPLLIFISLSLTVMGQSSRDSAMIRSENGENMPITAIGRVSIILKGGRVMEKCYVWQIGKNNVEYKREGSLHDMPIDKIERIDIENSSRFIYFDSEHTPFIRTPGVPRVQQDWNAKIIPDSLMKNGSCYGYLLKKNGDTLSGKITKETEDYIFYTDKNRGLFVLKDEIAQILIAADNAPGADHTVPDPYKVTNTSELPLHYEKKEDECLLPTVNNYQLGRKDAETYYSGNGAFAGGVVSGIFFPYGWFPATLIAATPVVNLYNSENPNVKLLDTDPLYKKGYKNAAHSKKAGKTMKGFVLGIGLDAVLLLAALALIL
jgi:hypothetical protein